MTTGEPLPRRGEIWWVRVDKRRPAIAARTDHVRDPRAQSCLVVPLTSRPHLAELPGNLRLEARATGLPKTSVANVFDLQRVLRSAILATIGQLTAGDVERLDESRRLALGL